ncbi:MAG: hypothetical protein JWO31_1198, partial [Phycisphaerales bacterium]|nr:hypothetical protein [Phycisphaerales bacterium]
GTGAEQLQREARVRDLERYDLDTRYRANEAVPPGQRVLVDYGAFLQGSYLSLDDAAGNNRGLRQVDLIPYVRVNWDGAQELFLRGRFGYRDFNKGDSFDGLGDEPIDGDLDRGYYSFDLRRYNAAYGKGLLGAGAGSDFNLTFKGGRDLAYWGNGLVLGTTLDGITVGVEKGPLSVEVIAGVTPTRTVDFDSSRPGFDYNTRRGFYGVQASLNLGDHRPYAYGLLQRDYNKKDELDLGLIQTRYEYNSYYLAVGSTGGLTQNLRYGVELAYEGGNTLSNSFEASGAGGLFPVEQTRNQIQAIGFDARLDYLVNDRRQTRFSAEVIATSGDADRGSSTNTFNGNRPNTTDRGFNAFGLVNTGLAFAPDASNLLALRVGAATLPLPEVPAFSRLQLGFDFFVLGKLQERAPIDEPTADHRFLGLEPDLYLNWQVTSDLTLAVRYGVFFPSDQAFGSNTDARQFLYTSLTFAF